MKSKKTSRIVAESSLSVQINGGWYKFSALEEQELSGYTEDEADEALSGEKTPYIIPKMTKNNGKVLLERASNVAYCARKTVKNAGEAPKVEFVTYLGGHPNIDTKLRTFGKKMDVGLYIVDCTYDKIEAVKSGKPVEKATVVETAIADDEDNN